MTAATAIKTDKTAAIRELNDQLRKTLVGGRIVLTCGVQAKGEETTRALMEKLRTFNDFSSDNDPYQEHDLGRITHKGERYLFKIDYYDRLLHFHSPDAANAAVTCRVLTLMLAEEY